MQVVVVYDLVGVDEKKCDAEFRDNEVEVEITKPDVTFSACLCLSVSVCLSLSV